ncbi:MAG: PspC domain-containing protein [Bacteroidales bacterium]|nr:PspC domain-containing protein [Bacteroidales bacterium]
MAHKKLYRTRNDAKIAGVCGGLAEYLDIDVTIVRIVFLLLLLTGSLGFWIYLIIWIVAPWDYMVR